jgi:5,6-dimethylbenzimidazole synthase
VVRDPAVRRQIKQGFEQANEVAAQMFEPEKSEIYRGLKLEGIEEAPLGICVTCDRSRTGPVVIGRTANPEMDLYSSVCAVQNLWLAARAENLGVGWVSIVHHDAMREALGIPEHIVPVAYLCIGYVDFFHDKPELEKAGWLPRLPLEQLIHQDRWQK